MINRKFIHFERKNDFLDKKDHIRDDSWVFIKDTNELIANNVIYPFIMWTTLLPDEYCRFQTADDFIFNGKDLEFIVKRDDI